jgi:hypothetical protein
LRPASIRRFPLPSLLLKLTINRILLNEVKTG